MYIVTIKEQLDISIFMSYVGKINCMESSSV